MVGITRSKDMLQVIDMPRLDTQKMEEHGRKVLTV